MHVTFVCNQYLPQFDRLENIQQRSTSMWGTGQGSRSKWGQHMSWLTNKFNQFCQPLWRYDEENEDTKVGTHRHGNNTKKESSHYDDRLLDPKMKVLNALRQNNLKSPSFTQKIKKANKYLTRKQPNCDKPCDLLCPICLQFMVKPVTTVCGHNFCMRCLDETLLFKPECPSCRNYLRGSKLIKCETLHKLILRIVEKYSEEEISMYKGVLSQAVEWLQSRTLNAQTLHIGQAIDTKDTEFIWCKATILQLYHKNNSIHSIKVHYAGWNSIYDEVLEVSSDRLAQNGFYTNRQDIPHYKIGNGEEERMYSYVVSSSEAEYFNNINIAGNGNPNANGNGNGGLSFGMGSWNWNGLSFDFGAGDMGGDQLYLPDPNLQSIQQLSQEYYNNELQQPSQQLQQPDVHDWPFNISNHIQNSQQQQQDLLQLENEPPSADMNRLQDIELEMESYNVYLSNLLQEFPAHQQQEEEECEVEKEEQKKKIKGEQMEQEEQLMKKIEVHLGITNPQKQEQGEQRQSLI